MKKFALALVLSLFATPVHAACKTLPLLTLAPENAQAVAGSMVNLTATVMNTNTAECPPAEIVFSSGAGGSQPFPNITIMPSNILTLAAGTSGVVTFAVEVPAGAALNSYYSIAAYAGQSTCTSPNCTAYDYSYIQTVDADADVCFPDATHDTICEMLGCNY